APPSANRHKRHAPWTDPPPGGDAGTRPPHRAMAPRHDGRGRRFGRPAEPARDGCDRGHRAAPVDLELAAQKLGLDEPSEDEVGVRQRGRAAAPEAGRPWIGTRALRADTEGPTRVDPCDSAA